jgi:hypothetical protein
MNSCFVLHPVVSKQRALSSCSASLCYKARKIHRHRVRVVLTATVSFLSASAEVMAAEMVGLI